MPRKENTQAYNKQINVVLNYIVKNLKDDLSLDTLAQMANYSPFHFQKIFKQVTGISPKQYVIMTRLENSSHLLIIHRHKSITEIALDSGFASPSTFARAFKNYFGISAEELRSLSPKGKISNFQLKSSKKKTTSPDYDFLNIRYDVKYWKNKLKVKIVKTSPVTVILVNAPLSDINLVTAAYKKIIQLGEIHDLLPNELKFIGLVNPHQGLYQASLPFNNTKKIPAGLTTSHIEGGRFATYKIKGDTLQTFHSLRAFYELWLPNSGYHIRNPLGMEILSENPADFPYQKIEREIYVPVEPA